MKRILEYYLKRTLEYYTYLPYHLISSTEEQFTTVELLLRRVGPSELS